ncbi:MAG: LemA family protein [Chlamydiota bacterium]|nr:LemA family protein [Chlamydiota bacterium]
MNSGPRLFLFGCGTLILIILIIVTFIVGGRNKVVTLHEDVNAAWAQVENQLQRRSDLIPNLVNTIKGYAAHEKEIFEHVADARSKLAGTIQAGKGLEDKIQSANALSSALSRLLVVVERYPDLKANENFARLQDSLEGTENRLAVERKRYNDSVRIFNAHIRRIPGSFFAGMMGLSKMPYFEVSEEAKNVPKVEF